MLFTTGVIVSDEFSGRIGENSEGVPTRFGYSVSLRKRRDVSGRISSKCLRQEKSESGGTLREGEEEKRDGGSQLLCSPPQRSH